MAAINYGRVAVGALVAGVVANVCDVVINGFIMADEMGQMVQRLNLNPAVVGATSTAVTWIAVDFVYAALIVWTYAAILPRFGAGPRTAAMAGVVIYGGVTAVLAGFQAMGLFTLDAFLKSAALSFVVTMLASQAGAYVYRDA